MEEKISSFSSLPLKDIIEMETRYAIIDDYEKNTRTYNRYLNNLLPDAIQKYFLMFFDYLFKYVDHRYSDNAFHFTANNFLVELQTYDNLMVLRIEGTNSLVIYQFQKRYDGSSLEIKKVLADNNSFNEEITNNTYYFDKSGNVISTYASKKVHVMKDSIESLDNYAKSFTKVNNQFLVLTTHQKNVMGKNVEAKKTYQAVDETIDFDLLKDLNSLEYSAKDITEEEYLKKVEESGKKLVKKS